MSRTRNRQTRVKIDWLRVAGFSKSQIPPDFRLNLLCRPPFLWTLVAIGAALRIFQYASDTSLWFDELSIVRNLVHRSEAQLATEPLRYHQVAPVGFLVAEKAVSRVLGESDLAFRALLLPVGLATLVAFLFLSRRVLAGYAVPFAVAMFAIGAPFIRYCAEVKQYGIDMAVAIVMTLVTLRLRDPDATPARCVSAGLLGALFVWFSQAAVLVLVGLGGALLIAWLLDRDARTARAFRIAVPIWAIACIAATLVAFRLVNPETRAFMDMFWRLRGGFPPWPIQNAKEFLWLWDRVTQLFGDPMVLRYVWPGAYSALAAVGFVVLWRRNRIGAIVLLAPLGAGVLAAVAQQYPFRTRIALYVLPGLVLGVAQAAEWIRSRISRLHPVLGGACMLALFAAPSWSFVQVPPPYFVEDHKTVLRYVRDNLRPGDAIYVYPYETQAVERYGAQYGLVPGAYEIGRCSNEDRRVFLRDADRYRGRPRVWVIAGAVPPFQALRATVENYLGTIGTRKASVAIPSEKPLFPVSAMLFDLSDPARLASASAETFPLQSQELVGNRPTPIFCGPWAAPLEPN